MARRKNTLVCKRCKEGLPRSTFDCFTTGRGHQRPYPQCRECRMRAGQYGGTGRPALVPPNPSGLCLCGCGCQTNIAKRTLVTNGYTRVKGHPVCYITGHAPNRRGVKEMADSWSVDPETGCWLWRRGTDKHGRGVVGINYRTMRAHRWVYETLVGPIADGMELDHVCVNPICVNPSHMEPVTHAENFRRDRLRRQVIGRLWMEARKMRHGGIIRIGDHEIGRLVPEGRGLGFVPTE